MADKKTSAEKEVSTTEIKSSKKPSRNQSKCGTSITLAIIAILISLGLVAGGFFGIKKLRENKQQFAKMIQSNNTSITNLENTLKSQQQVLNENKQSIQSLQQYSYAKNVNWVLSEAEYLTRLANYSINFNDDVPSAISLLQTADHRISLLHMSSLLPIRKLLNEKIVALKAIPQANLEDILLKLYAIDKEVGQLPITISQQKITKDQNSTTAKDSQWKDTWDKTLNTLKNVVIVRHDSKQIEPLLNPEQRTYLIQNVRLILQQAQWAALHKREKVYQLSLQHASSIIEQYFSQNQQATTSIIKELGQLKKIELKPEVPNINDLITLIHQYQEKEIAKSAKQDS